MGRKDDYQFDYLDDNARFADQINGALFNGKQVIRPEELEPKSYSSIDSETKDMLEIVANIRIPEKFKTIEEGKERYDMCKAFEDMRLEGYEAGIVIGRAEGIATEISAGIEKFIKGAKMLGASKVAACEQLIQQYALKENEANEKIELYWVD
ncbi:MAG: hypothetical protein K2N85_15470 [Lachnospiraceae bacterium]|nr:hypothetical protein [Lachnospiraceae bacterium]